jgi:uncharacterized membrane protein YjgN (DUF898 family)
MQEPEGIEPGQGAPTPRAERGDAIAGARTDASAGIDTGTSTSAQHQILDVRFVGSGSEYFRIWIVNLLLTLVTLGIYYPFAKCRRLRYFHGCTEVGGHPMDFHGNPWAMLRGFVLMAVLLIAYGLAQQLSELAAVVAFVLLWAIGPALWFSSLRFRLANTSWRGVRLRFTGTVGGAYLALWPAIATFVLFFVAAALLTPDPAARPGVPPKPSLGLALLPFMVLAAVPWLTWRAKRYQHANYEFTTERTAFHATVSSFYGLYMRTGLLASALLLLVIGVFAFAGSGLAAIGAMGRSARPPVWTFIGLLMLGFALFQVLIRAYFTSRIQNLVWNRTASPGLRFASHLRARDLALVIARNGLLILLTLGLYFPFAAVATARLRLKALSIEPLVDVDQLVGRGRDADDEAAGDAAADLLGWDIGL